MRKWVLLAIAVVLVAAGFYFNQRIISSNAQVAEEIRTQPNSPRARRSMIITLQDGREYPVNYLAEDNLVFMGIDGRWWREFQNEGAPVSMLIRGKRLSGHAKVVLDDPDYTADVFSRLRPTAPDWLPAWLNGKLVVITLSDK